MATTPSNSRPGSAIAFSRRTENLSLYPRGHKDENELAATTAVEAKFVAPCNSAIETANESRLTGVSLEEAYKKNVLKDSVNRNPGSSPYHVYSRQGRSKSRTNVALPTNTQRPESVKSVEQKTSSSSLHPTHLSSKTNPLFPPLPLYSPPTPLRNLQALCFRASSFVLSFCFLGVIVLGALFTTIPSMLRYVVLKLIGRDPDSNRPFHEEEKRRKALRRETERDWRRSRRKPLSDEDNEESGKWAEYTPTEGGRDVIPCDVSYYARRVGLDIERYEVQTEDGFLIDLWHIYDPKEYAPASEEHRKARKPDVFRPYLDNKTDIQGASKAAFADGSRRYPVLMIHGLLQSAGSYCTNDDDSLAFFLCKSGYDVWLGNNRCGFNPKHTVLNYSDPRMWAWNIRQMGVMDLPALVSRVLFETGFEKLGLVCHSQGTTQTLVALAKDQRPELGEKISIFCALAPAAYAGPLIGKMYFKFMRIISPSMFRFFFGIHSFIPIMLTMHNILPPRLYGALGYRVFSFLFGWADTHWEKDLRARMFQFAPVYVSSESMRWWLGRDGFARHKCILATREEGKIEDYEDGLDGSDDSSSKSDLEERRRMAWYNDMAPPMAMWIAGSDGLVDGRRLLRRFRKGREPYVNLIHAKVIEEYEHLDVLWAIDVIEKIGNELREMLWKTVPADVRKVCRVPRGCENIRPWTPPDSSHDV